MVFSRRSGNVTFGFLARRDCDLNAVYLRLWLERRCFNGDCASRIHHDRKRVLAPRKRRLWPTDSRSNETTEEAYYPYSSEMQVMHEREGISRIREAAPFKTRRSRNIVWRKRSCHVDMVLLKPRAQHIVRTREMITHRRDGVFEQGRIS